jgi:hypothetical protein
MRDHKEIHILFFCNGIIAAKDRKETSEGHEGNLEKRIVFFFYSI